MDTFAHVIQKAVVTCAPCLAIVNLMPKHVLLANRNLLYLTQLNQMRNVKKLDASSNFLTSLPTEVGQMEHLTKLSMNDNQLNVLPNSIGQLSNLVLLDVSSNALTLIPREIGGLVSLCDLNVSSNHLTYLPAEISLCKQLKMLDISKNSLAYLPVQIGDLRNLLVLVCHNNRLQELPAEVGQLQQLKGFFGWNNCITTLPRQVQYLTSLRCFYLTGNPLLCCPNMESFKELMYASFSSVYAMKVDACLKAVSDIHVREAIDGGGQGDIFLTSTEGILAKRASGNQLADVRHEALALSRCEHDNVVKFVGYAESPPTLYMVSFPDSSTLFAEMKNHMRMKSITVGEQLHVLAQLAEALAYLHSQCISHGDLKASNVLTNKEWKILLIDLGHAGFYDQTMKHAESFDMLSFGSVACEFNARCTDIVLFHKTQVTFT